MNTLRHFTLITALVGGIAGAQTLNNDLPTYTPPPNVRQVDITYTVTGNYITVTAQVNPYRYDGISVSVQFSDGSLATQAAARDRLQTSPSVLVFAFDSTRVKPIVILATGLANAHYTERSEVR